MKNKYISFVLIIVLLIGVACSKNTKPQINENTPSKVQQPKEDIIRIGVIDYPPYEYIENGTITGPGVEIVQEAFERMGKKYEMELYPWARLLEETKAGEIDVMLDVYYTKERAEYLIFSKEPYAIYPQTFIKRKGDSFSYRTLDDLSEYSIGIIRGFHYGIEFHEMIDNNELTVEYAKDINSNIEKLLKGRIDLVAETYYSAEDFIEKNALEDQLVIVDRSFDELISYVCFSKVNNLEVLRDQYDETIKQMRKEGKIREIYERNDLEYFFD